MLPQHMNLDESEDTGVGVNYLPGVSWEECRDMRYAGKFTLWSCNVPPRMIHHANMDTQTGRYGLGNVFAEPVIHARNHKCARAQQASFLLWMNRSRRPPPSLIGCAWARAGSTLSPCMARSSPVSHSASDTLATTSI